MELNELQKNMLNGAYGKGKSMAMEILVAIGNSFKAKKLVPIDRAHVSLSAQKADRWFAEKMAAAGATCAVKPTVNPGYSLCYFKNKDMLSKEAENNMMRVEKAYKQLGAILTYSCTPYDFINTPNFGDICSFSETSVTIYANSAVGARTNRESSFSALCSAITGFTPEYGYLFSENRHGDILVHVESDLEDEFDFSMLGMMGKKIGPGNPIFKNISKMKKEDHISLGAMLNISGSYTIYHVLGITPEALDLESATSSKKIKKEIPITQKDIMEMKKSYLPNKKIDFVMLGCPHYTFDQVLNLLSALKIKKSEVPIFILTSRAIIELLNYLGIEEELKHLGADLVPDTCVDEKLVWGYLKNKRGLSDSAKCSYYMSSFGVDIKVLSQKDCIRLAQGEELYV